MRFQIRVKKPLIAVWGKGGERVTGAEGEKLATQIKKGGESPGRSVR